MERQEKLKATCLTLDTLINEELEQRAELNHLVMVQVLARCSFGKGHVSRGKLCELIYHDLGFTGDPGNHFYRFMNKLLTDNGIRVSYSNGYRVYYGLVWKEEKCQEESPKPVSEEAQ